MFGKSLSVIVVCVLIGCHPGSEGDGAPTTRMQTPDPDDPTEAAELCDNRDNDGDGRVDEGQLERACSTRCESSTERCINGQWTGCSAREPAVESCDNRDNDCDGLIDEELTRECETPCGTGTATCEFGTYTCIGNREIEVETCDNQDNDCDGTVDENLLKACSSQCNEGYQRCVAGQYIECDARQPAQEVCGDQIDNDCDENVDEGCNCNPGDTQECSTALGVCTLGAQTCRDNGTWSDCLDPGSNAVTKPGELPELCNGLDDDCDGLDDNVPVTECGDYDQGECSRGLLFCENGISVCRGALLPTPETCDLKDNDCDGRVDEDLDDGPNRIADVYEPNPSCRDAEDLRRINEDARDPRVMVGTLYPVDDEDWYTLRIEDERSLCWLDGLPDNSFEITVTLSNVPEGADYRMCVHFARDQSVPDEGCFDENILGGQTICTDGPGSEQTVKHLALGRCYLDDSVHAYVRVFAAEGSIYSCAPYTLSIGTEQFGRLDNPRSD